MQLTYVGGWPSGRTISKGDFSKADLEHEAVEFTPENYFTAEVDDDVAKRLIELEPAEFQETSKVPKKTQRRLVGLAEAEDDDGEPDASDTPGAADGPTTTGTRSNTGGRATSSTGGAGRGSRGAGSTR